MITVEKKKKSKKNESDRDEYYLAVNGIADRQSFVSDKGFDYAYLYNVEVIDILTSLSFNELGTYIPQINYSLDVDWWESWLTIEIVCIKGYEEKTPCINVNLQLQDWEHWSKPWSMSGLANQFKKNINELKNKKIKYWQEDKESILNGFGVKYLPSKDSLIIQTELDGLLNIIMEVAKKTEIDLISSVHEDSVLTYFQFPEEIKTACKQYLVYFTQFIADIGITVDTELKEELNYTLFKITPENKDESLGKIRDALSIYLSAASDNNLQAEIATQSDIAAMQWQSNIYHLKSQLALAKSLIQSKDATIEALQLSNYQYKKIMGSDDSKKESEKEEIIKGIVEVKKYEGKGFNIDFAELLRRLKRKFK